MSQDELHNSRPPIELRKHDRLQLEIKVTYPAPDPMEAWRQFQVDLWFHLPGAVGIADGPGATERFYGDVRAFTRLRTPEISLAELARADGRGSPLATLAALAQGGGDTVPERWRHEVCQAARLVPRMLRRSAKNALWELQTAQTPRVRMQLLRDIERCAGVVTARYRDIAARLGQGPVDGPTRTCIDACDEYLSLQVELLATHAVSLVERDEQDATALRDALVALARSEVEHRRRRGWKSCLPPGDDREAEEAYLDRVGQLKRYVQRVLHLRSQATRTHQRAVNIIRGFAAALAMTWAVALQIFTFYALDLRMDRGVGTTILVTFGVLTVLGYILKDRLKAWTAEVLTRELPRFLDDRHLVMSLANHDAPVAQVAERATFEHVQDLPPDVLDHLLHVGRTPLRGSVGDDVLHYRRQVRLSPRAATEVFPRFVGTVDVLRLNLTHWVRTLAAPSRVILVLDEHDQPRPRKLANRYPVAVLARVEERSPEYPPRVTWTAWRILLNQRGISRVEGASGQEQVDTPLVGAYL